MARDKLVYRVVQIAFHRNGVGGAGFHAVLFESATMTCPACGDQWGWVNGAGEESCMHRHAGPPVVTPTMMLASVFDEPGHVAVYDVAKLTDPKIGVAFGPNSWRGDRYEDELRQAISTGQSDGSFRVGPFALPTERRT